MDHLSSCYFCGTALDRPLQTVRLADSADAEDAPALTLCPPCRRKLQRVFEIASGDGSVDLGASGDGGAGDETVAGEDGIHWGNPGGGPEDPSPEAVAGETPEEILEEVSSQDDTDEVDAGETAEPEATESDSIESGESTGDAAEAEETASEAGEDAASDAAATESAAGTSATTGDSAATADDSSETGGDTSEAGGETSETGGHTSGTAASGGNSSNRTIVDDQGGSSVSALEYNKVIRLLQNREFPVDRDEIETIAANAYDLRRAECAAILDLAIERDVLAESKGQLYRPD